MSTETDELDATLAREVIPEPERIALRSSLPPMGLPDFPTFESKVELPRLPSIDESPAKSRSPESVVFDSTPVKELDLAFFPNRAMLPELALLAIISSGWIIGAMPFLPAWWQSLEVYASVPGAYGLFVMVRWLFNFMGGGYRLTNRQLLRVTAGPIPDPEPIDLRNISSVEIQATIWETCLCVGRLKLRFVRDSQPEVLLGHVSFPRRRKVILEEAIAAAREASVVGARIPA